MSDTDHLYGLPAFPQPDGSVVLFDPQELKESLAFPRLVAGLTEHFGDLSGAMREFKITIDHTRSPFLKLGNALLTINRELTATIQRPLPKRPRNHRPHRRPHRARRLRT